MKLPIAPQLAPDLDAGTPTSEFWSWLRQHELRVQQCGECGWLRSPPSELCPRCQSLDAAWIAIEPKGEILAWTRVWHPVLPDLKERVPYLAAWIGVEVGSQRLRFLGNILGDPMREVRAGDAVVGTFQDAEAVTLLNWLTQPDASGSHRA